MSDKTMGKTEQLNKCQTIQWGKQRSKMNKQSSKVNVRQYNGVNRGVK